MHNATAMLKPTFTGYVETTHDALILFEACLTGALHHVHRRPHDRERHLVRSGSVFIYDENPAGIERWTDGLKWSPSRILGNFLIYRELEKPLQPGQRGMKKANRSPVPSISPREPYPRQESNSGAYSPSSTSGHLGGRLHTNALVGSLVKSYNFKDPGLVKKTIKVTVSGVTHHLVSYYSVEDVMRGVLYPPSMVESLRYIRPRAELMQGQRFRGPIDGLDVLVYGPQPVAPPEYSIPSPHPWFYMHATLPPQSASILGYSLDGSIPPQAPPNPYLSAPSVPIQIHHNPDNYSQFSAQSGTIFDSLGHNPLSSPMSYNPELAFLPSYHPV